MSDQACRWFSLRRRLLGLLLGGIASAWSLTMVFSYLDAHHEIDELFDAQLAQSAQTLLALATHDDADERIGDLNAVGRAGHDYQRRLRFQLWRSDGRLAMRSENAPETPLTVQAGFGEGEEAGTLWRTYSQWNREGNLQVQVAEDHAIRIELAGNIAWRLLLPALFGLPLIGLGVWLATRQGLKTLDSLAAQIAGREAGQLQALTPSSAPNEIRPMLQALNALFGRVEQALLTERRFTADAAHELRTPLAALLAQAEVAQHARDEDERQRSLGQLRSGLERTARLVEQMLLLARLDPQQQLPSACTVDLALQAEIVCAELGNAIFAKQLDFHLSAAPACLIHGQPEWLQSLMRNLIDNAIRYTPAGGRLAVTLSRHDEETRLEVSDSGPGIPEAERSRVMERFYRLHGGDVPGSGLGLAIVSQIAALHGARLVLADSDFGGLKVQVIWAKNGAGDKPDAPATAPVPPVSPSSSAHPHRPPGRSASA